MFQPPIAVQSTTGSPNNSFGCLDRTSRVLGSKLSISPKSPLTYYPSSQGRLLGSCTMCSSGCERRKGRHSVSCVMRPICTFLLGMMPTQSKNKLLATFERIAKEGRKYGVSLLVVSQRPSDVSRTILSQCNNFLVLRLTNDSDQSVVKRLMPDSMAGLTEMLPLLDTGEALMLGDAVLLPTTDSP